MDANQLSPDQVLSTILKHDRKTNSYKIALLRAIGDVVLAFPNLDTFGLNVAIPLRILAHYWMAYYWPFVDSAQPIWQGQRAKRDGRVRNDISFRPELAQLRQEWERVIGDAARPSDGFFLANELRAPRKLAGYPPAFQMAYQKTIKAISRAIEYPIRYAGEGEWTVFPKPERLGRLDTQVVMPTPGAKPEDKCLLIPMELWDTFRRLSLWVEALCIHEWSLYTERVNRHTEIDRGLVYRLLTDRPDNRRPLTWERNQVELLIMEGSTFICPWTGRIIRQGTPFDLDHLLPLTIYPTNELWNLMPSIPEFNQRIKRDRLPSSQRLAKAQPYFVQNYDLYLLEDELKRALREDVSIRFPIPQTNAKVFSKTLAQSVVSLIEQVADARNIARF